MGRSSTPEADHPGWRSRLDLATIECVDPQVARILRENAGMERLRLAHEAWELARNRLTAFVAARHPEWSAEQVRRAAARRLSGEPG